jgi:multidrug efflux pump
VLTAISDRYGDLLRWIVTKRWEHSAEGHGWGQKFRAFVFQARWIVIGIMALSALAIALGFPQHEAGTLTD